MRCQSEQRREKKDNRICVVAKHRDIQQGDMEPPMQELPERLDVKRDIKRAVLKIRPPVPCDPCACREKNTRSEKNEQAERIECGLPGGIQRRMAM